MAKIAYGIFAYRDPEMVARIINRLHTESDLMYIHFDTAIGERRFRACKKLIEQKCPNENTEIVSVFRCKWGSFGLVDSFLSAMKHFNDLDFDYFINLTEGCYPLKSTEAIKREFNQQNSVFMEVFEMPFSGWDNGGMPRIQNRFYFVPSRKYPYVRIFSIPRIRKKLPLNLKPYGGSGFFCLPREVVKYVVDFVEKNPSVRSFFRRTHIPDEMFFQTILMNSHYSSRIVNDNKRYVDWNRSTAGGHPAILTKSDFDNIKTSGKLFARKFDPSIDSEILNLIDQDIEETEMLRNLQK